MRRWIIPIAALFVAIVAIVLMAPFIQAEAGKYISPDKPVPALPQGVSPQAISLVPDNSSIVRAAVTLPAANVAVGGEVGNGPTASGDRTPIVAAPPGLPSTAVAAPEWAVGDWWTVNESYCNVATQVADPPWSGPLTWNLTVAGIEEYDGEPCFVINATCAEQPETWGRAYYNVSRLALRHAEVHYGPPSGATVSVGPADIMSTTGDVSLFAIPMFPANMTGQSLAIPSLPGEAVAPEYSLLSSGGSGNVSYRINLMSHGHVAAWELWHPGAPWWLYLDLGSLKARLIDCSWWHR